MRIFLDSSVILAACISPTGASRHICDNSEAFGWSLLASPYVAVEVLRNLSDRPIPWMNYWRTLHPRLVVVSDVMTISNPVVFSASKDKPVLFSAYAFAEVLLTLDGNDFSDVLSGKFYGLHVLKPADFLMRERKAGRI